MIAHFEVPPFLLRTRSGPSRIAPARLLQMASSLALGRQPDALRIKAHILQVLGQHDLLKLVLGNLPLTDVCISAVVCRHWREVASSSDFWIDVNFEGRSVVAPQARILPVPPRI